MKYGKPVLESLLDENSARKKLFLPSALTRPADRVPLQLLQEINASIDTLDVCHVLVASRVRFIATLLARRRMRRNRR